MSEGILGVERERVGAGRDEYAVLVMEDGMERAEGDWTFTRSAMRRW